ncbi:hypothetical protein COY62_03065 [bacterium (Candidatus Howlettbacteria) CG_4_10_14_0_8_um_filter_40_9]|nr:MAG: hypothetical protein COY62_03065 [bacterium (Candidatus Howlettbacteria) CG_4_10_14_0_8_um_filter_40_9]
MKVTKKTLKNGIRVISSPSADTKSVAILFMVKTGSRNETKEVRGISHFLEHMVFKGTEKRPTAMRVAKDIESLGAINNAFTGKEQTGFFIKTTSDHFDKAVEILYDIVFNSTFEKENIETESKVILEEKKMYEENPLLYIDDLFEEVFFDDEKLSQGIIGTVNSIKGLRKKDFHTYLGKYYTAKNIAVSVAGDVPKNYLSVMDKYLSSIKAGKETGWESRKSNIGNQKIKVSYKDNFQSNLILGYQALKISDEKYNILSVLSGIIGGGMSSRLFQEVREKRGLAYSIHSETGAYSDGGYFEIEAGVDSSRAEEAVKVIVQELTLACDNLTEEELMISKERMKGSVAFSFEDSFNRANFYARREMYHQDLITEEELIKKIEKVDLLSVKKMAKEVFSQEPTLALIGPFKNKEKFVKILLRS